MTVHESVDRDAAIARIDRDAGLLKPEIGDVRIAADGEHHLIGGDAPYRYTAAGRYLDVYRKIDGRWLFASRRRVIDWSENQPIAAAVQAVGVARGSPGADDPVYLHLPRLAQAL